MASTVPDAYVLDKRRERERKRAFRGQSKKCIIFVSHREVNLNVALETSYIYLSLRQQNNKTKRQQNDGTTKDSRGSVDKARCLFNH